MNNDVKALPPKPKKRAKNGETENGIRINLFNDINDYLANAKTNQTNH